MKGVMIKVLKAVGITCLLMMIGAYFALSTVVVQQKQSEAVCHTINVQIVDSTTAQLVVKEDVLSILEKKGKRLLGEKLSQIDLYQLEQLITEEKGINHCEVFTRLNGVVTLRIAQQSPILRLETVRGSFYLDNTGVLFSAIPQRTAYVPVVSGNIPIERKEWIEQLYLFGNYIRNNRFWNAQIEQLYVHDLNNIEIIQRAGTHTTVMLGNLDRFETKLQKLYTFYQTVASTQGWNQYTSIDLRYQNQIVCRK